MRTARGPLGKPLLQLQQQRRSHAGRRNQRARVPHKPSVPSPGRCSCACWRTSTRECSAPGRSPMYAPPLPPCLSLFGSLSCTVPFPPLLFFVQASRLAHSQLFSCTIPRLLRRLQRSTKTLQTAPAGCWGSSGTSTSLAPPTRCCCCRAWQ